MRRVRKQKNIIIGIVMLALFVMTAGYAVYQKKLDISGVARVDYKDWNIRILSIENVESSNGVDVVEPSHTNTTAKFNSKITKVGGYIKYKIVVKNSGTIDGVLGTINIEETEDSVITYTIEGAEVDDELKVGEEAIIYVTATYDSSKVDTATSNKSNVTLNLTYVQLEGYVSQNTGYLALAPTSSYSSGGDNLYWLNSDIDKKLIESISFTTSKAVPSDVGSNYWDASYQQNGSIMGWYYDTDSDGLYEVYVGQKGGVIANPNSRYLFSYLDAAKVDLTNLDTSTVYSLYGFFTQSTISEIVFPDLDTSMVNNTSFMFSNFKGDKEIDLSFMEMQNVKDMTNMFFQASEITSLNISGWDTSNVERMKGTFGSMFALTSLDLSDFDTNSATTMYQMFYQTRIANLDLSSFNTSNVTDMSWMFYNTSYLETVDVSSFDTSNVETMIYMFGNVSNATSLDLSSFNTINVKKMDNMFVQCYKLETIYVSDLWTISSVTSSPNMFYRSDKLVGGSGITYDSTKIDASMANYQTGYFTYKAAPGN